MMRFARMLVATAVVGGLGVAVPGEAAAQQPELPQEQEAVEVTDELVERFVAIYPAVAEVAQEAQNELATAESAEEAQAIQADAQARVIGVLEDGGMTPLEYDAVVTEVNEDPELLAKVERMLEDQGQGGGV